MCRAGGRRCDKAKSEDYKKRAALRRKLNRAAVSQASKNLKASGEIEHANAIEGMAATKVASYIKEHNLSKKVGKVEFPSKREDGSYISVAQKKEDAGKTVSVRSNKKTKSSNPASNQSKNESKAKPTKKANVSSNTKKVSVKNDNNKKTSSVKQKVTIDNQDVLFNMGSETKTTTKAKESPKVDSGTEKKANPTKSSASTPKAKTEKKVSTTTKVEAKPQAEKKSLKAEPKSAVTTEKSEPKKKVEKTATKAKVQPAVKPVAAPVVNDDYSSNNDYDSKYSSYLSKYDSYDSYGYGNNDYDDDDGLDKMLQENDDILKSHNSEELDFGDYDDDYR